MGRQNDAPAHGTAEVLYAAMKEFKDIPFEMVLVGRRRKGHIEAEESVDRHRRLSRPTHPHWPATTYMRNLIQRSRRMLGNPVHRRRLG